MAAEGASRKRQRASPKELDDDSKKPRGRPRVDGQDETAADRRRTQIRLAQRAYRQRKENTISTLRDQVSALQSTIEEMNKSFLAFNDKVVGSNLLRDNNCLAKELRSTTQQFLLLAKSSDSSVLESGDSESESIPHQNSVREDQHHYVSRQRTESYPRHVDIGLGYVQVLDDSNSSNEASSPNMPDPTNEIPEVSMEDLARTASTGPQANNFGADFPLFTPPSIESDSPLTTSSYEGAAPSSVLQTVSLKAPYTYSIEETTFARRLHRAALERAYHILATAHQRPAAYTRVFRLSLLYHSRETIMEKLRQILTKPVDEPLEFYHTPFFHLGGAGTHYGTGRKQNAYVIKSGPIDRRAVLQHLGRGFNAGITLEFDPKEYEGEWFDSNDVEGYLLDLGMSINPRITFAEVHVPNTGPFIKLLKKSGVLAIPDTPSPPAWPSTTQSLQIQTGMTDPGVIEDGATRLFPELGLGDASSFSWSTDMNDASNWIMGAGDRTPEFLSSGWSGVQQPSSWDPLDSLDASLAGGSPPSPQEPVISRKITIDVGKFIDEMHKTGICLGRSPGFRKKDVERSLLSSIVEVL